MRQIKACVRAHMLMCVRAWVHNQNNILTKKYIFGPKLFFTKNPKKFFYQKIFFTKNFFLTKKSFLTKKFFWPKNFFWPKIFFDQTFFLTKHFFYQKIFWPKNFFWPIFFTNKKKQKIVDENSKKLVLALSDYLSSEWFSTGCEIFKSIGYFIINPLCDILGIDDFLKDQMKWKKLAVC